MDISTNPKISDCNIVEAGSSHIIPLTKIPKMKCVGRHHNPPRQREREDRQRDEDEAAAAAAGDMDWKTHSLPSLGRISSDNTLESSGGDDCYTVQTSTKNRKSWRNNKQVW